MGVPSMRTRTLLGRAGLRQLRQQKLAYLAEMELRVPVNDPTGKEPRSELADWIELSSIVSASGSCGAAELRTLLNREEDRQDGVTVDAATGDELDDETLDSAEDQIEDAVVNELEF